MGLSDAQGREGDEEMFFYTEECSVECQVIHWEGPIKIEKQHFTAIM